MLDLNIHEYQCKAILKSYGLPVPNGCAAFSVDEAVSVATSLNTPRLVVKAQIHAGGRGKAGGVKLAHSVDEVRAYASDLLGSILVTHQTGPQGKRVNRLLIEEAADIKHEFYLAITVDRASSRPVIMASTKGGVDIESVAANTPELIFTETIDPLIGLASFQANRLAFKLGFEPATARKAVAVMRALYDVFAAKDCSLAEINPLVLTESDDIIALDAKLNFDDSALYRHRDIDDLRDVDEEEPKERAAANAGLNYVNLGGNVACMVNGAGLAMATIDILKASGADPANFLDVGGDSTPDKIATAFHIMLDDGQAEGIFVNIFGGINKCDLVAQGIVKAAHILSNGQSLPVPVVVRLEGTNVEQGRRILTDANIHNLIMADSMERAAHLIVDLVNSNRKEAS